MAQILEVISHPTGPWLIKAGQTRYVVPRRFGQALQPLAGSVPGRKEIRACLVDVRNPSKEKIPCREIDNWSGELARALRPIRDEIEGRAVLRRAGRTIRLRVPLIPEALVRKFARRLQPLAGSRGLSALALVGGAGYLAAAAGSGPIGFSLDLGNTIAGLGLFFLSAVWHELGHASALARWGYPPGGIGAGALFVIPVLFADVTAVGALPRAGRLVVDGAGLAFQVAAGGCFMAAGAAGFFPHAMTLAGGAALFAICWSLFPFIRSDGYWLLCDLLGLPDLDRPPLGPFSWGLRIFLPAFQLANAVFLLGVGLYFPWRMSGMMSGLISRFNLPVDPAVAPWLTLGAGLAFLGMMGIGIARRIRILLQSAWMTTRGRRWPSP